jgi:predicted phage terminase large subunit-like protein
VREWSIASDPHEKQKWFLGIDALECLYGGAGGGGKTEALLMAALQYVHVPNYNALIIMRTFQDLKKDDAPMDRSHQWLRGTAARWIAEDRKWLFPSSATLSFGYLQHEDDKYNYKTAQYQFIAFDELTSFEEGAYLYLFTRLRRLQGYPVPLRVRSATNPDGPYAEWVRKRFVPREYLQADVETRFSRVWEVRGTDRRGRAAIRYFVPARLEDNPHIDQEAYEESLAYSDEVAYHMIRNGDWEIRHKGKKFYRSWFEPLVARSSVPYERLKLVRSWDVAHTSPKPGEEPDYSVGILYGLDPQTGTRYVLDVVRFQGNPGEFDTWFIRTAKRDGEHVPIVVEQEPAAGINLIWHLKEKLRDEGLERIVYGVPPKGDKETRANPVAMVAKDGLVAVVDAPWSEEFLSEIAGFPHGAKKDQVDALSQAETWLVGGKQRLFSMYFSYDHHVVTHAEMRAFCGRESWGPGVEWRPPSRWNVLRVIWTDELGLLPGCALYLARPPLGSIRANLAGSAFVFKLVSFAPALGPDDVLRTLEPHERAFASQIVYDLLPPWAKKLQEAYAMLHDQTPALWDKDDRMGIAPLKDAMRIDAKRPHPILDGAMGQPNLYLVVETDAANRPKANDRGLLTLRQALENYYVEEARGAREAIDFPALVALRAAASVWFGHSQAKTREELIDERMPEGLRSTDPLPDDPERREGVMLAKQVWRAQAERDAGDEADGHIFFGKKRLVEIR